MNLLPVNRVELFKGWLNAAGADVLSPTNPYELVRFDCPHGIGVLYTGKRSTR